MIQKWMLVGMFLVQTILFGPIVHAKAKAADTVIPYEVGNNEETKVTVRVTKSGSGPIYFAPHDNENISVQAALKHVRKPGGTVVQLQYGGERNVTFRHKYVPYSFDPNRMFSNDGIKKSLQRHSKTYSQGAHREVHEFAQYVIAHLKMDELRKFPIVALHNNTEGRYSIESYEPKGKYAAEAEKAYRNPKMDSDDFFFVTTMKLFQALKKRKFNVVLQNQKPTDDGSLSVFAAERGVPYVNVEAQHDQKGGHLAVQSKMLEALHEILHIGPKKKNESK